MDQHPDAIDRAGTCSRAAIRKGVSTGWYTRSTTTAGGRSRISGGTGSPSPPIPTEVALTNIDAPLDGLDRSHRAVTPAQRRGDLRLRRRAVHDGDLGSRSAESSDHAASRAARSEHHAPLAGDADTLGGESEPRSRRRRCCARPASRRGPRCSSRLERLRPRRASSSTSSRTPHPCAAWSPTRRRSPSLAHRRALGGLTVAATSKATYTQSSPAASNAALKQDGRERVRDRLPITAATRVEPVGAATVSERRSALRLLMFFSCSRRVLANACVAVLVDDDVEEPRAVGGVQRRLDRGAAGHRRSGVGGSPVCL